MKMEFTKKILDLELFSLHFLSNIGDFFQKYLTATPEYVNFEVLNDTSDRNNGSITIETLDTDSSNLLLASNDIMDIGSPKRMKL